MKYYYYYYYYYSNSNVSIIIITIIIIIINERECKRRNLVMTLTSWKPTSVSHIDSYLTKHVF